MKTYYGDMPLPASDLERYVVSATPPEIPAMV
jgi:hypothetical protein